MRRLRWQALGRWQEKSQCTVWIRLGDLWSAITFVENIRDIDRAPKIWRPQKPQTDQRILDRDEARALLKGAHDPHVRLALPLLGTGAWLGAVSHLT